MVCSFQPDAPIDGGPLRAVLLEKVLAFLKGARPCPRSARRTASGRLARAALSEAR